VRHAKLLRETGLRRETAVRREMALLHETGPDGRPVPRRVRPQPENAPGAGL
jgi:hypothetical protein